MDEPGRPPRGPGAVRAILTVAHLTFQEARRRRVLAASLGLGAAFVAIFATGLYFIVQDMRPRTPPEIGRASCRERGWISDDGIRDADVTGVQTCALPISRLPSGWGLLSWPSSPPASTSSCRTCARVRPPRSEERRVGKEGGSRTTAYEMRT